MRIALGAGKGALGGKKDVWTIPTGRMGRRQNRVQTGENGCNGGAGTSIRREEGFVKESGDRGDALYLFFFWGQGTGAL